MRCHGHALPWKLQLLLQSPLPMPDVEPRGGGGPRAQEFGKLARTSRRNRSCTTTTLIHVDVTISREEHEDDEQGRKGANRSAERALRASILSRLPLFCEGSIRPNGCRVVLAGAAERRHAHGMS